MKTILLKWFLEVISDQVIEVIKQNQFFTLQGNHGDLIFSLARVCVCLCTSYTV